MTLNDERRSGCLSDTRGLASVEYILIACLVTLLSFGAFKALGGSIASPIAAATATIAQLPGESNAPSTLLRSAMGSGSSMGSLDMGGGGGCAAHVAEGGGAGTPCDPASFGSCVGGGEATVVVSCDGATGLTVTRAP